MSPPLTSRLVEGDLYRALFNQSAVGVAQIERSTGRFVLINQLYCDLVGYTVAEMLQRDFQSITHPDDLQADLDNMDRLRAGTLRTYQMNKRYLRKDGAEVWVRLTVVPLWAPGAAPDCHLAVVENITDRKRAEEALQQSEDFLQFALTTAKTGAWNLDLVDHTAHRSLLHDEIFGYPEPLPRWSYEMFLEHVISEDREAVERSFRHSLATRSDWNFECRILRRDGETRWIRGAGRPRPKNGQPRWMAGIVQDITEHKVAEQARRESEEHFRTMANAIPQLAWIADPGGYIRWFNARWYEYTGTTPERMEGWGWQSVHDPITLPKVLETWKASLATGDPFDMVFPLRGADGVFRPFLTRVLPVKNAQGQVTQWFGTGTDVTEVKRIEREQKFLAQFSSVLASTLSYEETPRNIANLIVDEHADVCVVETLEESSQVQRFIAHRDPGKAAVADALQRVRLDARRPHLGFAALEAKKPVLMTEVSPEYLDSIAQSEEHRRVLREMGATSFIALPLLIRERLLGALVFIRTAGSPRYTPADLPMTEEVAHRSAFAIESARLYQTAERALLARDEVLGIVAHDLRNPLGAILMGLTALRSAAPPQSQMERYVTAIEHAATRMTLFAVQSLTTKRRPGKTAVSLPAVEGLTICRSAPRTSHGVSAKL